MANKYLEKISTIIVKRDKEDLGTAPYVGGAVGAVLGGAAGTHLAKSFRLLPLLEAGGNVGGAIAGGLAGFKGTHALQKRLRKD